MHLSRSALVIIGVVALVGAATALYVIVGVPAQERAAAQSLVEEFGTKLQGVSLLEENAPSVIASTYTPYATPELIESWQADPENAPGRLTSSPWPVAIKVNELAKQGSGYVVNGSVVMETSSGAAGEIPLVILVVRQDGDWRIAAYQEQISEND